MQIPVLSGLGHGRTSLDVTRVVIAIREQILFKIDQAVCYQGIGIAA